MNESPAQSTKTPINRVLIVSIDDPQKRGGVGGKHTHIRLLSKGLEKAGVACEVISARETTTFNLTRKFPGAVARRLIKTREERFIHYQDQYMKQFMRSLRKASLAVDVVNPHDVLSANLARRQLGAKKIPIVLTLHGYYTREATSDGELVEGSAHYTRFQAIEAEEYQKAWRIICVDSRIKDYVLSMSSVEPGNIAVIPNAVDVDAFQPTTPDERNAFRKELGIPEEARVVICPRRLVPKNGVSFAVRGMTAIIKSDPQAMLVLAGDGPERREIELLVKELNLSKSVVLAGSVAHERISRYYAASDYVVIPSVTSAGVEEATSLAMLEGMASGKPVIVTDVGGLKETVIEGKTGLVVPQRDPEAIANAVARLSADRDLRESISVNALNYVREHHSYIVHARRVLAEYEKALASVR